MKNETYTALDFVKHVLKEQLKHGEHGDAEYISLAYQALENEITNNWPEVKKEGVK